MVNIIYKNTDLRYIFLTSDNPLELEKLEEFLNKIPN